MGTRILVCLLCLAAWGARSPASAQSPAPCPAAAADTTRRPPDLVIRASARVAEARFHSQPQVAVKLTGCAELDSVRVVERRNLPEVVQPGTTYRDVFVAVEILGHIDVQCLLGALPGADTTAEPDPEGARRGRALPCPAPAPARRPR